MVGVFEKYMTSDTMFESAMASRDGLTDLLLGFAV